MCRGARSVAALFLAAVVLLPSCGGEPAPPIQRRNVVLFVVDTLRADHLGCYGYDRDTTPFLDGLAARGARVADVTAQSSWTGPSMVSLFTARRVAGDFVRMPPAPTLAEHLQALGWRTLGFQDNILLAPGTGYDRGFDRYEMEIGRLEMLEVLNAKQAPAGGARDGANAAGDADAGPPPTFFYVHLVGPHDPWEPGPTYDIFEPRPLPADQRAALEAFVARARPELSADARAAEVEAAAAEMAKQIALYDGDIRETDARIEYVLSALDRAGHLDDALVVVAADHGEGLWEHEIAGLSLAENPARADDLLTAFKRTHNTLLYEELTRVPLLFQGPGVPAGVVLPGPAENVDIVPTILDLLDAPPLGAVARDGGGEGAAAPVDGVSLLPALEAAARGEAPAGRSYVVSNTDQFTAVRDAAGRKLIVPRDESGPDTARHHDLTADPAERELLPLDTSALRELLGEIEALRAEGLRPLAGEGELDDETRERMRALGYLGPDDH